MSVPLFVSKPQIVEAEQYTGPARIDEGDKTPPFPAGVEFSWGVFAKRYYRFPWVLTAGGRASLDCGDWVVTYSDGKREAYSPEAFARHFGPMPVDAMVAPGAPMSAPAMLLVADEAAGIPADVWAKMSEAKPDLIIPGR